MSYDSALLTGAQLVEQTGVQDLANLEADAELDLDTLTLNAQRWVYRQLYKRGIDPTAVTNESWLKDAIAWATLARLADGGYLGERDALADLERAKAELDDFTPTYSATVEAGRSAGEGMPAVGHVSEEIVFGLGSEAGVADDYLRSNLPTDLS